jgi:hypothetical protein
MKVIFSRLSFNVNGWSYPSGSFGKSRNNIHERIYGFGFEEWLFNKSFITKDEKGSEWQFGYIEGIHKNYKKGDENYPLMLFTIDARTRNRYIVAEIKEWKKLEPSDSTIIINQNPKLINQMHNDLIPLANSNALNKFLDHQNNRDNSQLFNIKFKEFSFYYDINNPLPRTHRIYTLNRFWLYR